MRAKWCVRGAGVSLRRGAERGEWFPPEPLSDPAEASFRADERERPVYLRRGARGGGCELLESENSAWAFPEDCREQGCSKLEFMFVLCEEPFG